MGSYAIVKDGLVINVIVWDGEEEFTTSESGEEVVVCEPGVCCIGASYVDGVFTPPPTPEKTHDELVTEANQQKTSLIDYAASVIDPLKDALDGGYIEEEDKAKLTAWQKYRYQLTKVDTSTAPDISWPVQP
ncbi:tail fiber assembly protein [Enterobacter kobei]|uniref:tail fiber assembly protein n=1 Tax=Enterobacter kobei TaxID=208224 RepID=UPI00298C5C4F|nr:tail fiber assembly protein [Enterobacter kobei]